MKPLTTEEKIAWMQRCQREPKFFFQKALGVKQLWEGQEKILDAFPRYRKIAVSSGNACGKDFISAGIALAFCFSYYPSKVIITAPTDRQVKEVIWGELTRHYRNATIPLGGTLFTTKLSITEDWFIIGFTTKEAQEQKGKFQGFHSPNILIIVSEAQAVTEDIYQQIDGLMTSSNAKLLLIGNPLTRSGYFAKALQSDSDFHRIELSCLDTPNVREKREVIPGLVSYEWVEEMRQKYGEDSREWRTRVLGKLPVEGDVDSLIPFSLIENAINLRFEEMGVKILACDPAEFGDDETVLTIIQKATGGWKQTYLWAHTGQDLMNTTGRIIDLYHSEKPKVIIIDKIGIGAGIVSRLQELKIPVLGFNSAEKSITKNYYNKRAEGYYKLQEILQRGQLQLMNDEKQTQQLLSIRFEFHSDGRKKIVSKEKLKKEGIVSPDRADALMMAVSQIDNADSINYRALRQRTNLQPMMAGGRAGW